MKSLKDCTDEEILLMVKRALDEIRESPNQYGEIRSKRQIADAMQEHSRNGNLPER